MIDIKEKAKKYKEQVDFGEKPTPRQKIEVPEQGDHIFPIQYVAETTNKLKQYNNQLDIYVYNLKGYEKAIRLQVEKGPGKINLSFISKLAEKFCKRLNYWLAWLRYLLLKGLSGVYKKFKKAVEPLQGIYDLLQALINMDISIDTVVGFITGLISFLVFVASIIFLPIIKFIEFVQDVATYTPPLINEGTDLISNASDAVQYGTSLTNEIRNAVEQNLNSDFSPEVLAKMQEKYIDVGQADLSIHFEPITVDMIFNSEGLQPPKWEDYA